LAATRRRRRCLAGGRAGDVHKICTGVAELQGARGRTAVNHVNFASLHFIYVRGLARRRRRCRPGSK